MLETTGARPVHTPTNPDVFEFDAEVAAIFPDMAQRAIPLYHEGHRTHVAMLAEFLAEQPRSILDIGASRGAFFKHLKDRFPDSTQHAGLLLTAVDSSLPMCTLLREEFPDVLIHHDNLLTDPEQSSASWRRLKYDVVVLYYVLQFLPLQEQLRALHYVMDRVEPGGYLVFGHKELLFDDLGRLAQQEYMEFRVRNGYTREEIAAKSKALKGAMFQRTNDSIIHELEHAGFTVQPTVRWLAFNAFIARKP